VITITGLTHKQKALMDVMWSMEDMRNVQSFIKTLPTRDRQDCLSLIEIAVQETLEEDNRIEDYEQAAVDLIARVSSR
jgi:hypothetical protein